MFLRQGYQILNGPDREALFDSLRLIEKKITVQFEWLSSEDTRQKIDVQVIAIQAYSDENHPEGGNLWLVQASGPDPISGEKRHLVLDYSTQSKTGYLLFCSDEEVVLLAPPYSGPNGDIGREGLYIKVTRNAGEFYIGPFGNAEERAKFLSELQKQIEQEGGEYSTLTELANAMPKSAFFTAPDLFYGLNMFDDYFSDDSNFPPDEEEEN